jgi:DNA-binding response OmpR family regulator
MKILLVSNDEFLSHLLTRNLAAYRHIVDRVTDGETGWTYATLFDYDLIVLDPPLQKLDGIRLCQQFRTEGYTIPILLLIQQDDSSTKVTGLDAGADDCLVKPFDMAELCARIRALLRRSSTNPLPLLTWSNLLLNPSNCEVTYNGQPLSLTPKEYELLELFLRQSQHVFSTDEILRRLWSSEEFPSEATVRSHIRRVRHKLAIVGAPIDFIATVHGRGYYLKAEDEVQSQSVNSIVLTPNPSPVPKVMIVDDDRHWLQVLSHILQPWGFKLTTLAEPQNFWTVLQAVNPDLLVLDINMPETSGFELCRALRGNDRWQRLPVVFLSGLSDTTTQNYAFSLGADDYLCKPVRGTDLANRILNRLQRVRAWAN